MTRKELYDQIKSLHLQDEIKSVYKKHYTNCSNIELESILKSATKPLGTCNCNSKALEKLVEILAKKRILLTSEVTAILNS